MVESVPKRGASSSTSDAVDDREGGPSSRDAGVAMRPPTTPPVVASAIGAPEEQRLQNLVRLSLIAGQLALALIVIYRFQLESRTFFQIMLLATGGFVVHSLLPLEYRLPFYVSLSIASILLALGLVDGLSVIGLGLLMIGICHLPVRLAWRTALLASTAAVFALWRLELMPAPWAVTIWPVL